MNMLIHIDTNSELISYEAVALAFVLASFEHKVQLYFDGQSIEVLSDPASRVYGMVQSLSLYEMPVAWLGTKIDPSQLDTQIMAQFVPVPTTLEQSFDSVLRF